MTPPHLLLRDAAAAALVVVLVACAFSARDGVGAAAGGLAGLVNLAVLWWAVRMVERTQNKAVLGPKTLVAALLLVPLVTILPAMAVMAGFFAPLMAFTARGVLGALRPQES